MTPIQQAFADGFAVTLAQNGQTFTRTSDGAQVIGAPAAIKPGDAKMANTQDRDFTIFVADPSLQGPSLSAAQVMPSSRLKKADELTKSTGYGHYRVVRADLDESTGLWAVVLSPAF